METRPNVLLVVLDSVRARNTSLHGRGNPTTPFLESFAAEDGTRAYEGARAPGIHTVASHASIFTGYHVAEHGVVEHESSLDPERTVWHALAAEHGYRTGLFSPNFILTTTSNLAAPFGTVDGPRRDAGHRYFEDALAPTDVEGRQSRLGYLKRCLASGTPLRAAVNGLYFLADTGASYDPAVEGAGEYVDSFLDWSAGVDGPWAACLNLMDAHYPYVPHPDHAARGSPELRAIHDALPAPPSREIATTGDWWKLRAVESLYDDCIRAADAALAELVAGLRERGALSETLVVIAADHGEGFGEWSLADPRVRIADHAWGISEVLTHVPLVVRRPGRDPAPPDRGDRLASLTRFPDAVLAEVTGGEASFAVDRALASTVRLSEPERVLPDDCPDRDRYGGPWRAVYEARDDHVRKHVRVRGGDRAATVRIEDATSARPVAADDGGVVDRAFGRLEDAGVRGSGPDELAGGVEDRLEELGYLR